MSFCSVSGLARAATISGHATRSQGPADGPDEFLFFCLCDLGVCGCHMVSLIFALQEGNDENDSGASWNAMEPSCLSSL